MTDKVEQIRAEVERLLNSKAPSHDSQCDWEDGYWCALYKIEDFIDSLQEEPAMVDAAESLGISQEEYDKIVDKCIYGKEDTLDDDKIEKNFKVGDVVCYLSRHFAYGGLYILGNPNDLSIGYNNANEPYNLALRNCAIVSENDRKMFMRELNSNGYRWNENTLRIEKEESVSEELREDELLEKFNHFHYNHESTPDSLKSLE